MKYSRIKSIITHILEREFDNEMLGFKLENRLPNPKTVDFLTLAVVRGYGFEMVYYHERGIDKKVFPPLVLRKKGREWYLGNYYATKKKYCTTFENFSDALKHHYPLYFVNISNNFYLPQFITQKPVLEGISQSVAQINQQKNQSYKKDFVDVLARFANTLCKLKIVIADCEGDFYVTHSRIWSYESDNINISKNILQIDNIRKNVRFPNAINWGNYLTLTTKIVQISYKNRVLFSTETFTEDEMKARKEFRINRIIEFAKKRKEEQENAEE